ncbi:MAG: methyltransferase domain-containing protein [Armatimonadota bacterium]
MTDFNEIAQGYENWYFTDKGKFLSDMEKKALMEFVEPYKGEKLLDIGCGTGFFSTYFQEKGFNVTGVDSSLKMLEIAKSKDTKASFVNGDAKNLPFGDDDFNISTMITSLEFCEVPEKALQEACRVTRSRIVLGVLNKLSFLALERFFKKNSIYRKATLYTPWGLKNLIKRALGEKVKVEVKIPFCTFMAVSIDINKIPQG